MLSTQKVPRQLPPLRSCLLCSGLDMADGRCQHCFCQRPLRARALALVKNAELHAVRFWRQGRQGRVVLVGRRSRIRHA